MNKYLAVLIGVVLSLNASANSYVFGGRAHFYGALVGSSCVFAQESDLRHVAQVGNSPTLKLKISNCSLSVYHNLVIVMKYVSNGTNVSISQVMTGESAGLMSDVEINHLISLIGYSNEGAITKKNTHDQAVILPIPIEKNQLSEGNTNILISVFYP